MKYLGMDVHEKATVYGELDAQGQVVERGSIATTAPELTKLERRLLSVDKLVCGQEVGTMSHFVHDIVTEAGATILSFNAHHLRMIASSRKKTDKRDAYWIAKCLQTGMMPHPVHVPTTEVRRLRSLLAQRLALANERKRWLLRARSHLRAMGTPLAKGVGKITNKPFRHSFLRDDGPNNVAEPRLSPLRVHRPRCCKQDRSIGRLAHGWSCSIQSLPWVAHLRSRHARENRQRLDG